jgi:hypothetical protein
MNTNKILVSGVVGGVFAFLLGWLIWGILLKDSMPDNVPGLMRGDADFIMWAMVVSNLAFGIFLAYIYVEWASISTWLTGAKAGAILGLLMSISIDFSFFAMSNMFSDLGQVAMDIVANTVWTAIVGAFIGWWLGWRK